MDDKVSPDCTAFSPTAPEQRFRRQSSRFISLKNARLHLLDEGQQTNLPVIVMLSSQWLSAFSFDDFVARIQSQTRILRVDLPGHGLSGKMADGDYSAHSYARLIDDLMKALKLPSYVLIGMSFSGIPATIHAAQHPPGLRGMVFATSSGLKREINADKPNEPLPKHLSPNPEGAFPKEFYAWKLKSLLCRKMNRYSFAKLLDEVFVLNEMSGRRIETATRVEHHRADILAKLLSKIPVPVLVQWSSDSTYLPPEMASIIGQAISDCVLIRVYPSTGHLLLIDAPNETANDILDFMRNLN